MAKQDVEVQDLWQVRVRIVAVHVHNSNVKYQPVVHNGVVLAKKKYKAAAIEAYASAEIEVQAREANNLENVALKVSAKAVKIKQDFALKME